MYLLMWGRAEVGMQASEQWFSTGSDFVPRAAWGPVCRCFLLFPLGEGVLTSSRLRPGTLLNILGCTGHTPTSYLAPNISMLSGLGSLVLEPHDDMAMPLPL